MTRSGFSGLLACYLLQIGAGGVAQWGTARSAGPPASHEGGGAPERDGGEYRRSAMGA